MLIKILNPRFTKKQASIIVLIKLEKYVKIKKCYWKVEDNEIHIRREKRMLYN